MRVQSAKSLMERAKATRSTATEAEVGLRLAGKTVREMPEFEFHISNVGAIASPPCSITIESDDPLVRRVDFALQSLEPGETVGLYWPGSDSVPVERKKWTPRRGGDV